MRAGELRQRVQIQRKTTGQGSLGQPSTSWQVLTDVWADIRHLSGMEGIKAGAITSTVQASCRLRWRDDVTPADRIAINGTAYNIEAVLPDTRRQFVDLVLKSTGQPATVGEPANNGGWG